MPEVEAHLGEVLGSIAPMRPIRRVNQRNPRWIEHGTVALFVTIIGSAVGFLFIILAVCLLFMFAGRSPVE